MEKILGEGIEIQLAAFIWVCIVIAIIASAQTFADYLHSKWLKK